MDQHRVQKAKDLLGDLIIGHGERNDEDGIAYAAACGVFAIEQLEQTTITLQKEVDRLKRMLRSAGVEILA